MPFLKGLLTGPVEIVVPFARGDVEHVRSGISQICVTTAVECEPGL